MPLKLKLLRLHPQKKRKKITMEANNINNILYIKHTKHNKYNTKQTNRKLKVNRVNLFGLGKVWNKVRNRWSKKPNTVIIDAFTNFPGRKKKEVSSADSLKNKLPLQSRIHVSLKNASDLIFIIESRHPRGNRLFGIFARDESHFLFSWGEIAQNAHIHARTHAHILT